MLHQDVLKQSPNIADEVGLLHASVIEIGAADNVESALTAVLRRVCEKTGWIVGQAWLPNQDATKLQWSAAWIDNASSEILQIFVRNSRQITFAASEELPGRVLSTKQPVWIPDISADADFRRLPSAKSEGITSALGIPVLAGEDAIAVLEFFAHERREEDEWQTVLIATVASQLGWTLRHKRSQDALRASEERYRVLVENAPICIHEIDRQKRLTAVNPAGLRMLGGAKAGEVCGLSALNVVSPADQQRISELLDEAFAGQFSEFEFQTVAAASSEPRAFLSCFIPLWDKDGEIRTVLGTSQDISNHKRAEEQLRQAQKMEALGRLAGGVAHDFNNILNVIIGYTYLLQRDTTPETVGQAASEIKRAADRATSLTRQMLTFSRKHTVQPEPRDLNGIIDGITDMLRRTIREDIELRVQPTDESLCVTADIGQIEQIIMNLAVNARDAMPQGGQLTISTRSVELTEEAADKIGLAPGKYAVLTVTDTGHGMDANTQARAFEPFFTTKEPGQGTGLGLATVYGIVRKSGGHVSFESIIGRGTTFTVHLPESQVRFHQSDLIPVTRPATQRFETILLVEDEESVRKLTKQLLQVEGYSVLEAANGSAALEAASRHAGTIDLLIVDVVMPGIQGPELAMQLKCQRHTLKVLFITGYAEANALLDDGIIVLEKPFTPEALSDTIRQILS
jgi:two-component system, cell cycle sensor histidine kinase and response regulator CckA